MLIAIRMHGRTGVVVSGMQGGATVMVGLLVWLLDFTRKVRAGAFAQQRAARAVKTGEALECIPATLRPRWPLDSGGGRQQLTVRMAASAAGVHLALVF